MTFCCDKIFVNNRNSTIQTLKSSDKQHNFDISQYWKFPDHGVVRGLSLVTCYEPSWSTTIDSMQTNEMPTSQQTATESQYATTPTESQYATTPTESQYATTPTESQYATTPSESQYAITPTESQYATTPTESQYATTSSERQHTTTPTESQYATTPIESQYVTTPSERQHTTTPNEIPILTTVDFSYSTSSLAYSQPSSVLTTPEASSDVIHSTSTPNSPGVEVASTMSSLAMDHSGSTTETSTVGTTKAKSNTPHVATVQPLTCPLTRDLLHSILIEDYPQRGGYSVQQCADGYTYPDGTVTRTFICLPSAQWHTPWQGCIRVGFCEDADLQTNSNCTHAGITTTGGQIRCSCRDGLVFSHGLDTVTLQCSHNGQWLGLEGRCAARCGPLPYDEHSVLLSPYSNYPGSVITMACQQYFKLPGGVKSQNITCSNDTLTWTDELTCQAVSCPPPVAVPSTRQYGTQTTVHSQVLYVCGTISGNGTTQLPMFYNGYPYAISQCLDNAQWSLGPDLLQCTDNTCSPVPRFTNAFSDGDNATEGVVVTYTCLPGYEYTNASSVTIVCVNKQWTPAVQDVQNMCKPLQCNSFPSLPSGNMTVSVSSLFYLGTVTVSCPTGYSIARTSTNGQVFELVYQCSARASWTPLLPGLNVTVDDIVAGAITCTAVVCSDSYLFTILGAILPSNDRSEYRYGASVTITCTDGKWFRRGSFNQTITCSADGLWAPAMNPDYCTDATCPAILLWRNLMFANESEYSQQLGTVVLVRCLEGSESAVTTSNLNWTKLTCQSTGDWQPAIPECVYSRRPFAETVIPTEAKHASVIGVVGVAIFILLIASLIILDMGHIRKCHQRLMRKDKDRKLYRAVEKQTAM